MNCCQKAAEQGYEQGQDQLDELNKKGTTICMVTHDLRYAGRAKTQLKLLDGEIVSYSEARQAPSSDNTEHALESAEVM